MRDGPTSAIRERARRQLGFIRWRDAREEYLSRSLAARQEEERAAKRRPLRGAQSTFHYHMSIHNVLKRNAFMRVEGTGPGTGIRTLWYWTRYSPDQDAIHENRQDYRDYVQNGHRHI